MDYWKVFVLDIVGGCWFKLGFEFGGKGWVGNYSLGDG
jgi:hypothetical protein